MTINQNHLRRTKVNSRWQKRRLRKEVKISAQKSQERLKNQQKNIKNERSLSYQLTHRSEERGSADKAVIS